MKQTRLTVNRIASAGIRSNRRAYIALGLGIWLAVFFVSAFFLCANGAVAKGTEIFHSVYGLEDIIAADTDIPDSTFADLGLFDAIGHAYNTAYVTDTPYQFGWYDETGTYLLNRSVLEGRMPENSNEIAMEISTFLSLGYTADDIGTVVTLTLTPQNGTEEEHTFTLVGMLNDQSSVLDQSFRFLSQPEKMPSIIAGGPIRFETGRSIVHTLMTLNPGVPLRATVDSLENYGCVYGILTGYGPLHPNDYHFPFQDIYSVLFSIDVDQLLLLILLGGSLVISACVGIAGALENRLAGRTEEIGMLRAVGATRRQIRRIFGRESWLLALVLSPLSVGTACLAARILSLVFPSVFAFAPDPLLLIPVFALSALCILFASAFPLHRASKQAPMGVLRDTALLRKALHVRTKPKFTVPSLLAERQIRLHPARQIGSVILVGILCISAASAFEFSSGLELDFDFTRQEAFEIWCYDIPYQDFENATGALSLTDADLMEIRSLPGVRHIDYRSETLLLLHTDAVPQYMLDLPGGFIDNDYLLTREQYEATHSSDRVPYQSMIDDFLDTNAKYTALRSYLGTSDTLIKIPLIIVTSEVLNADIERNSNLYGNIRIDALDSGSEILAVAPDRYYKIRYAPDGTYLGYDSSGSEIPSYDFYRRNDMFSRGDTVTLTQLLVDEDIYKERIIGMDYPGTAEYYTQYFNCAGYLDRNVSVGAVLSDHFAVFSRFGLYNDEAPQLLTTYAGAKALGIDPGTILSVDVYVDPDIDEETEKYVSEHISAIISRAGSYGYDDCLAYSRRSQETSRERFYALIACTLLFFCVSVAMVSGDAARRIRADARMIGTLRAVGAEAKVITGCYTRQLLLQISAGTVFAIAFSYLFNWLMQYTNLVLYIPVSIPVSLLFAALCFAFCRFLTGIRVCTVFKSSIIENIREL